MATETPKQRGKRSCSTESLAPTSLLRGEGDKKLLPNHPFPVVVLHENQLEGEEDEHLTSLTSAEVEFLHGIALVHSIYPVAFEAKLNLRYYATTTIDKNGLPSSPILTPVGEAAGEGG